MRKLILPILLCLSFIVNGQGTQPATPQQLTTNSAYLDLSNGTHWFYNGATYLWWQALAYKDSTKYVTPYYLAHNYAPIGSGVTSFNGRTGSVVPLTGDYAAFYYNKTQSDGLYQILTNLATSTSLGTSNILYPSQNAVKTYVDNAISGNTYTAGYGLGLTANQFRGDSTVMVNKTWANTVIPTATLARINLRVPYTGATSNVTLGSHDFTANAITINSNAFFQGNGTVLFDGSTGKSFQSRNMSVFEEDGLNTSTSPTGIYGYVYSEVNSGYNNMNKVSFPTLGTMLNLNAKADSARLYNTVLPTYKQRIPIDFYGKKVVIFGDSYTTSTRATNTARGYTQQFCAGVGAIEVNNGAGGTTLEKRSPIDYMSNPNMVDRISSIPTYDPSYALLVFQYGLNDLGYNGGAYSSTNYIIDYTTVLNGAIAKGWPVARILLIPPPFIGSVGYASYAGITGQPAPTRARHLDFVSSTKAVANTFGTLYIPLFDDQLKNDTTLLDAVAGPTIGIHPTDAGYAFIANDLIKFFGGTLFTGNRIPHPSLTPIYLEVDGASYGTNPVGDPGNLKGVFYNDGTNKAGIGESANNQEYQIYGGGSHSFYIGGANVAQFTNSGAVIRGLSTGANTVQYLFNGATNIGAFGSEYTYNATNALNTVLWATGNHSLSLATNNIKRVTIDGAGNISATLPAYSSGTNLPVIYNSTNGRFETGTAAAPGISTFTTTGSSGAATFSSGTLNIPNYTLAGLGGLSAITAASTYVQLAGGAGGAMTGSLSNQATDGGLIFMKNGTGNVSLWSTTKGALGTGSNSDMLLYVYGNNPFVVQTNGVVRQTISGTGAATFSSTIAASNLSLGGNFTTSGAFNTTLTATGTTAVTLPVTGTLATLAGVETLTNKTLTSPVINSGSLGASSTATTQSAGDNSTKVATTAYVDAIKAAVTLPYKSASSALDFSFDSSYSITSYTLLIAGAPGSNKTITMPTSSTWEGRTVIISNQNTGGFTWSLTGATTTDAAGTTITTLTNGVNYQLIYIGGGWLKVN